MYIYILVDQKSFERDRGGGGGEAAGAAGAGQQFSFRYRSSGFCFLEPFLIVFRTKESQLCSDGELILFSTFLFCSGILNTILNSVITSNAPSTNFYYFRYSKYANFPSCSETDWATRYWRNYTQVTSTHSKCGFYFAVMDSVLTISAKLYAVARPCEQQHFKTLGPN